jgi:uroporphyrin-III C-methyltransferase
MRGEIYLVGAGPGDPELITVKGLRLIREADVIVHDSLIGIGLLDVARPQAEIVDVGKRGSHHKAEQEEINGLLLRKAAEGKKVVRLKGGDPFLFGRGGEEAEELRHGGAVVHLVPGVSSSIAAPGLAGMPVTHRDAASMVSIVTGHESADREEVLDWKQLASLEGTLVIMMGMSRLRRNMERLHEHGMDPATPVGVVRNGSLPEQKAVLGTVDTIADICDREGITSPAVIVVGRAAEYQSTLGDLR